MVQSSWKQQYIDLVKFLGIALGPDYEVVLHDVSEGGYKLLSIANGHVSGRAIDAPLSKLALSFILNKSYKMHAGQYNYEGISADNRQLRCSTFFIKNEQDDLVGMLCINFNASKYTQFASDIVSFMQANYPLPEANNNTELVENFSNSVVPRFDAVVFKLFGEDGLPEKLSQNQKIAIIKSLDDCGVFMIKGAIAEIAELLGSSVASVYRYIGMVKRHTSSAPNK